MVRNGALPERVRAALIAFGGWLGGGIVAHFVSAGLSAAQSSGHDITALGRLFISEPTQLWIMALAAIVLTTWVIWPRGRKPVSANGSVPPLQSDETNELKAKVTRLTDEAYQANAARYEMRVERDGLTQAVQVVASQRDHAQAELRDLHRSIAETMVPRTTAQTLAQERDAYRERLGRLTPLVNLLRSVAALTTRLQSFKDDMEEVQVGDRDQELRDIDRIAEENATAFARDFRPDLVRLATDAKQRFGLVYPGLTDEALARDVRGQSSLDEGLQGLRDMKDKIRDMLLNEALEIDDK